MSKENKKKKPFSLKTIGGKIASNILGIPVESDKDKQRVNEDLRIVRSMFRLNRSPCQMSMDIKIFYQLFFTKNNFFLKKSISVSQ